MTFQGTLSEDDPPGFRSGLDTLVAPLSGPLPPSLSWGQPTTHQGSSRDRTPVTKPEARGRSNRPRRTVPSPLLKMLDCPHLTDGKE